MIDLGFSAISSAPFIKTLLENIVNDITGNELKENINSTNNLIDNNENILYTNIIDQDELITNDYFVSNVFLATSNNILDLVDTIQTRKEATQIAVSIQDLYTNYKKYYDIKNNLLDLSLNNIKRNNNSNTNINDIIQNTLGILIEISFNLKTEFNIFLSEDSNLIDIAYKYYKEEFINNPEETINKIVKTNKIINEEFIFIPKGRKIAIYL